MKQPIKNRGNYWQCCLCKRMKHLRLHDSYNANPIKNGRCCETCNLTKVLPQRWINLLDA